MQDKELITIYMAGFNDCPDETDKSSKYKGIAKKAYELGWQHYILGDDISSVDCLSEADILEMIKGE